MNLTAITSAAHFILHSCKAVEILYHIIFIRPFLSIRFLYYEFVSRNGSLSAKCNKILVPTNLSCKQNIKLSNRKLSNCLRKRPHTRDIYK